ncbi:MAG: nitrous oxide reductase family maturation protein NosD [Promethearchaeota archaeon]
MGENKGLLIGIIGIIIGTAGLGLGSFMFISDLFGDGNQGPPGQDGLDGEDAPGYYCNTSAEVQNAINLISSGSGIIVITEDITINATIDIDQGGAYTIQGNGSITVDCGGNRTAFRITNVETCTIQDLKIDTTDFLSDLDYAIYIADIKDNPVYIKNIQINGAEIGFGIKVNSSNVWIQNCYLSDLNIGISLRENSDSCHILDNLIVSMYYAGITLSHTNFNTLNGNIIKNQIGVGPQLAIHLYLSNFNTLSDNIIDGLYSISDLVEGIGLAYANNNTLSNNIIHDIFGYNGSYGIMSYNSEFNTINSNTITNIYSNLSETYGIFIFTGNFSVISGNKIINIYSDISDAYGIYLNTNNNTIYGNLIQQIYPIGDGYGIYLNSQANYNIIIGNIAEDIKTDGIYIYSSTNQDDNNLE